MLLGIRVGCTATPVFNGGIGPSVANVFPGDDEDGVQNEDEGFLDDASVSNHSIDIILF